ncbi:hypothetical protein Tco_1457427 [Tanacetum coccineum]
MPPKARPLTQAAIVRIITSRINEALTADRARRVNAREAGRSGQGGELAVRECTFAWFMKCNPTVFHGTEGAVELRRWFEKTKMVFGISECKEGKKVKFVAAALLNGDTAYRLSDTVPVFRIRISVLLSVFSPPRAHPTDYFALDNRLQGPYTNTKLNGTYDHYLDTDCMPEKNYNANNARNVQEGQGYMENLACKTSACKIRKFEMMKYTFEANEEYVAIKELINHSETNKDARSA